MNYIITFGLGTLMKNMQRCLENKTEDDIRELASTYLRGS